MKQQSVLGRMQRFGIEFYLNRKGLQVGTFTKQLQEVTNRVRCEHVVCLEDFTPILRKM